MTGGGPVGQAAADMLPLPAADDPVDFQDADDALTIVKRLAPVAGPEYGAAIKQTTTLIDCAVKSGKAAFRAYGWKDPNSPIGYSEIGAIAILTRNQITDWKFLTCVATGGVIGGGPAVVSPCFGVYDFPHSQPWDNRYYALLAATNPHMCKYIFGAHYGLDAYIYRQGGVDLTQPIGDLQPPVLE